MKKGLRKTLASRDRDNQTTMTKSPTNGMDIDKTPNQDKNNTDSDPTVATGKRTIAKVNEPNIYEGLNGIKIKLEEMEMAEDNLKDKTVSPTKRTKSDQQVIVIEDEEMDIEQKSTEEPHQPKTMSVSVEKGGIVTPTKAKTQSRNIDFMAGDEEEDEEATERLNKVLDKWDDEEKKREDYEREAVAFWNQTDPDFIGLENGKWYDLVNNDDIPLEQPTDAYIKTFNKTHQGGGEAGWKKVVGSSTQKGIGKKKETQTEEVKPKKSKPSKKNDKRKVQASLSFSKTSTKPQGESTSSGQQTKKKISFARDTKPPKDDTQTTLVDKVKKVQEKTIQVEKKQTTQQQITDTIPTVANKTFAEATKDPSGFNRITRKYQRRFSIAFTVTTKISDQNDGESQEQALRKALETCLREGQKVDMSFGIMPWKLDKPLPTIFRPMDAYKLNYDNLVHYLRAPMQGYGLKTVTKGRNYKWRFNATFNDPDIDLFDEKWNRIKANTVHIKDFPTQTEQAWVVGFAMGSTEKQDLRVINEHLETITGVSGATCSYQYLYHRNVTPALWRQALQQADLGGGALDIKKKHRWAPAAVQFFVPNREDVVKVRKVLYERYGKNVTDEHGNTDAYPTWPGGAQMKFVPHAESNMSDANKEKIGRRIQAHTMMKANGITFETDIKDPNMKLQCLKGKTFGETILGIMTEDKKNPVFRHFQKDWTFDLHENRYSLVSHTAFEKDAKQCMETLKNILVDEYGDEVLQGFKQGMQGLNNPYPMYGSGHDGFKFEEDEEDDKWLNNSISCTVTNMSMIDATDKGSHETESESVFTNLDKSAAFSVGSDRSDAVSISSDQQLSVPSLTSSQPTKRKPILQNPVENQSNASSTLAIEKNMEINTGRTEEGIMTQNSSISGLTGTSTIQTQDDLFKRMAESKSIMEMLRAGILTEDQVKQIVTEMTTTTTGAAAADEPGKEP